MPKVYLTKLTAENSLINGSGAQIVARDVTIDSARLENSGGIHGHNSVEILGKTVRNTGQMTSGGTMMIDVERDV